MPPVDVNNSQVDFEDAVDGLGDGTCGYLMLVFTGNGRKDWLYYTKDIDAWMAMLNSCMASHSPCPLDIENWRDAEWATWKNFAD
jgi:hypothetical protein